MKNILIRLIVVCGFLSMAASPLLAQGQGGNQGGGNQGGGGQGGGNQIPGGILIDADGVIRSATGSDVRSAALQQRLRQAAETSLSRELQHRSDLRKVSLRQLAAECRRLTEQGHPCTAEMQCLAGLTRVEYVFIVPHVPEHAQDETADDVVIAGPAEAFAALPNGRVVGVESGRPVLLLEDLRTVLNHGTAGHPVGCSFDPDPTRLAKSQEFLRQNQRLPSVQAGVRMFQGMADILGHWNVSVFGVPNDSRMAMSLVEADIMLKRITLGLENPGIRGFRNQLTMLKPGDDVLRRWWFVPHYDAIETQPGLPHFRLSGGRFQLMAQDEVLDAAGNRRDAEITSQSSEKYAQQFTAHAEELSSRFAALADLQNIIDLLVVGALIRQSQASGQLTGPPEVLRDAGPWPLPKYQVPKQVACLSNARLAGRGLMLGLVAGGVSIRAAEVVGQARETAPERPFPVFRRPRDVGARWWWD